jgi:hypothetical protein
MLTTSDILAVIHDLYRIGFIPTRILIAIHLWEQGRLPYPPTLDPIDEMDLRPRRFPDTDTAFYDIPSRLSQVLVNPLNDLLEHEEIQRFSAINEFMGRFFMYVPLGIEVQGVQYR